MSLQFTKAVKPADLDALGICNALVIGRFWSRVGGPREDETACWPWTGSAHQGGYGYVSIRGKHFMASHLSWMLHHVRAVPPGRQVLHACDNPPCVNPAHLSVGTILENMDDMVRRGRSTLGRKRTAPSFGRQGEGNGRAKLTADDVLAIRAAAARSRVNKEALGRQYDVSGNLIGKIISGHLWPHLN